MYILGKEIQFPPVDEADEHGFLAVGGDLSESRLLMAYRSGIFPWYNEDEPICWWSPDPRCVLYPGKLHISKSMQKVMRDEKFEFTVNNDFEGVMRACKTVKRKEGYGTWIQEEMVEAYAALHKAGFAHSAECWLQGRLVGGLYGIKIGRIFFGESMFATVSDASKFAFIRYVEQLKNEGVVLIDCQQQTNHLVSLGAEMISRKLFVSLLERYC